MCFSCAGIQMSVLTRKLFLLLQVLLFSFCKCLESWWSCARNCNFVFLTQHGWCWNSHGLLKAGLLWLNWLTQVIPSVFQYGSLLSLQHLEGHASCYDFIVIFPSLWLPKESRLSVSALLIPHQTHSELISMTTDFSCQLFTSYIRAIGPWRLPWWHLSSSTGIGSKY